MKIFVVVFSSGIIYAQNSPDLEKLKDDFKHAKNDSVFIITHSQSGFQVYQTDKTQPYDTSDVLIKELFKSKTGEVIGPFKKGNTFNLFKVTGFENAYKVHPGIIWIKYKEGRSEDEMAALAKQIFLDVKNGKDFNVLCHLYSDDNNFRKNCEIDWIYSSKIPPPLSDELTMHKRGDLFISHTKYGYHIVKMLDNPVLEKVRVQFVKLTIQ